MLNFVYAILKTVNTVKMTILQGHKNQTNKEWISLKLNNIKSNYPPSYPI